MLQAHRLAELVQVSCVHQSHNLPTKHLHELGQHRIIDIKRDSKTKTPSKKAESIGRSIQITSQRHTESD